MNAGPAAATKDEVRNRIVAFLPRLRRFCHGLAGDRDLGDDLLQATVERALDRWHQWQAGTSVENWAFKMASNLNIDRIRALKVRGIPVAIEEACELPGRDELAHLEFRSDLEAAQVAIRTMPVQLREVLTCVVLDDRSYREAAELLEIPIGTVMSRLSRARQFIDAHVNRDADRIMAA